MIPAPDVSDGNSPSAQLRLQSEMVGGEGEKERGGGGGGVVNRYGRPDAITVDDVIPRPLWKRDKGGDGEGAGGGGGENEVSLLVLILFALRAKQRAGVGGCTHTCG